MANWLEQVFDEPALQRYKPYLKYGTIALGVMGFLKSLSEIPETIGKDKAALLIIGHIIWSALQFAAGAVGLTAIMLFAIANIVAILNVFSFGLIDLTDFVEDEVVFVVLAILCVCGAIWLELEYGFLGIISMIGGYVHNKWILWERRNGLVR